MAKRLIHCAWCNRPTYKESGHINRQLATGCFVYCGRECSGLGRRKGKTLEQKRAEKADYDREYRDKNRAMLKAKKAARFKATYDPEKARIERAANMGRHVEYCRQPEYKKWKREYDRGYRAKDFGDFAEAYLLLIDIDKEVNQRASDYEVRQINGILNKKLQRRRDYDKAFSG